MSIPAPGTKVHMHGNNWFDVDRYFLPDNKFYDIVATKRDVVAVLPILQDLETMLLVKQFRIPIMKEIWEAPAGMIEEDEDPVRAALREMREETGYTTSIEMIWPMGTVYTSPGLTSEQMHLFIAFDCVPDDDRIYDANDDDHEEIAKVGLFPLTVPPQLEDLKTVALLETVTSLLRAE